MSSEITEKQSLKSLLLHAEKLYKKWTIKSIPIGFTTKLELVKDGVDTSAGDNGSILIHLAKNMTSSNWQKVLTKIKHADKTDKNGLHEDFNDYLMLNDPSPKREDYTQYHKLLNSKYPYNNFTYNSARYLVALLGEELLDYTVNAYW